MIIHEHGNFNDLFIDGVHYHRVNFDDANAHFCKNHALNDVLIVNALSLENGEKLSICDNYHVANYDQIDWDYGYNDIDGNNNECITLYSFVFNFAIFCLNIDDVSNIAYYINVV